MAFTILLGLMMIGAASSETGVAQGAVPSQQNVSQNVSAAKVSSNFRRCPCGVDCSREPSRDVLATGRSNYCPCRVCRREEPSRDVFATSRSAEGAVPSQQNVSQNMSAAKVSSNRLRCPCGLECSREQTSVDVFVRSKSLYCRCRANCHREEPSGDVIATSRREEPSRDVLETSSFLHCPCGIDCQKDVGKEHGFDLHQGCGCLSCNLRGATESKPAEGAKAEELLALLAEQEQDWDAASVPGDSQLTFCRCGSLGNSCRSCSPSSQSRSGASCPCGTLCLKRLQWFGGVGWCIQRQCIKCP